MKYEIFALQMKILKQWKDYQQDLEREIDDICYKYMGVRAIRYDKEPMGFNAYLELETREKMMEELNKPQKELDIVNNAIKNIEPIVNENLNKLPGKMQDVVKMLFWENRTYVQVGSMVGYSDNGLWHKVRKEIEKI